MTRVRDLFVAAMHERSMLDCWVLKACLEDLKYVVKRGWPSFPVKFVKTTLQCYRFSAFWLRSKCSICSYQLNIWYGDHVSPSILNSFLSGDEDLELAPALSRVGLVLQYHQESAHFPNNRYISSLYKSWWHDQLKICYSVATYLKANILLQNKHSHMPKPISHENVQPYLLFLLSLSLLWGKRKCCTFSRHFETDCQNHAAAQGWWDFLFTHQVAPL